jgi:hypothetical protein
MSTHTDAKGIMDPHTMIFKVGFISVSSGEDQYLKLQASSFKNDRGSLRLQLDSMIAMHEVLISALMRSAFDIRVLCKEKGEVAWHQLAVGNSVLVEMSLGFHFGCIRTWGR